MTQVSQNGAPEPRDLMGRAKAIGVTGVAAVVQGLASFNQLPGVGRAVLFFAALIAFCGMVLWRTAREGLPVKDALPALTIAAACIVIFVLMTPGYAAGLTSFFGPEPPAATNAGAPTPSGRPDPEVQKRYVQVLTYLDENGDGRWNPAEPSLPAVHIEIPYEDGTSRLVPNKTGKTTSLDMAGSTVITVCGISMEEALADAGASPSTAMELRYGIKPSMLSACLSQNKPSQ